MRTTDNLVWFFVFLIVNLLVTVIYFLIGMIANKTNRKKVAIRSVVMLCAPGVGPLLFLLSWIFYVALFNKEVDLSDVVFSKTKAKELVRTNEDRERNFVPVEEAIEITDKGELRNLVLNVAQGDYSDSLAAIRLALDCEDTETAHYAASVLQDALNDFRLLVQREYKRISSEDPDDNTEQLIQDIKDLFDYMNKVLAQKIFSDIEQKTYTDIMEKLMQQLYKIRPEAITSDRFEALSLRLLDVENYERCEVWCGRAMESFPNTLASYTSFIKLYFNWGDREKFFRVMTDLKESSIIIDRETLELIRAFQ